MAKGGNVFTIGDVARLCNVAAILAMTRGSCARGDKRLDTGLSGYYKGEPVFLGYRVKCFFLFFESRIWYNMS